MPKRTTEFQRLVYLVRMHSAAGSTVTESKFLVDSKGNQREVDICIESKIDGIPVTISIECNEKKRRASVKWVEEMKGMHDDLPTDVLILYSRSGFTKGAIEKAQTFRKRIVALGMLDENSAERLFGGASTLLFKASSQIVTKVTIGLAACDGSPAQQIDASPDMPIYNHSGQVIATAKVLSDQIMHSPKAVCEGLRIAQDHHKNFILHSGSVTVGPEADPIYLREGADDPPLLRLIESVTISGNVVTQTSPLSLNHGKLEDTKVAWATITYQDKSALIVASQDKNAETKVSFDSGELSVQLQRPPP